MLSPIKGIDNAKLIEITKFRKKFENLTPEKKMSDL
jgi:hypothetical protein